MTDIDRRITDALTGHGDPQGIMEALAFAELAIVDRAAVDAFEALTEWARAEMWRLETDRRPKPFGAWPGPEYWPTYDRTREARDRALAALRKLEEEP